MSKTPGQSGSLASWVGSLVSVTDPVPSLHRGTWDHSFLLPICTADEHYALIAPLNCWCHLPHVQQSVTRGLITKAGVNDSPV